MKRTIIKDTPQKVGEEVVISGWVSHIRDHGKIAFLDVRDATASVQIVGAPELFAQARAESAVSVTGLVKARPEKLVNPRLATGTIEIEAKTCDVLSQAQELPFDMGKETLELELPTLLDHRALTLKHPSQVAIFQLQAEVAKAFRRASEDLACTEVFVPTISASSTEGGAEVFKVDYYGHEAFLTQSPQLYKQVMVGVMERVYMFSHAYRAEPSVTTRHLSEVVQMDCEFAFIESFDELLDNLEYVATHMIGDAAKNASHALAQYGVAQPLVPTKVPRLTLREAQAIVGQRTGRDLSHELDLNPEDEKEICLWALEEHQSDFVTVTHYPTKKRAFYTHPDPVDPEYSLSFDVLFRGIEISSGSQRINNYEQLVSVMKDRGFNPDNFELYLQAFKYGMPPEGGFSFGLERITMKLLELKNVREAALFPRDMERVDIRLSKLS